MYGKAIGFVLINRFTFMDQQSKKSQSSSLDVDSERLFSLHQLSQLIKSPHMIPGMYERNLLEKHAFKTQSNNLDAVLRQLSLLHPSGSCSHKSRRA